MQNIKCCFRPNLRLCIKLLFILIFFVLSINNAQAQVFRYAVIPENPRQGDPVTVSIEGSLDVKSAKLISSGKVLNKAVFFPVPGIHRRSLNTAILAVPSTTAAGRASIIIECASEITVVLDLEIKERKFISEAIELNTALTNIRTAPDYVKTEEAHYLSSILSTTGNEVHSFDRFIPPVNSNRRTSFFGDRRVYKYSNGASDFSIHAGIDYGVPSGTPVLACAAGKVVLARSRIVTGNSVVIEHLPGIYSLYYHLEKINVTEGLTVSAGTLLGLSGATGLATGPHLHWEIRVFGEMCDPDAFIDHPVLDKQSIISHINNKRYIWTQFIPAKRR
ncbi:MAG: M23 family metallopeptidase [Treponema sp.]|nr:M23 family metallopeptidase [Treponema sp.]